jgi:hypothetical protein
MVVQSQSLYEEALHEPILGEPTLDEMFGDPIMKMLMATDKVSPTQLAPILEQISKQIQQTKAIV